MTTRRQFASALAAGLSGAPWLRADDRFRIALGGLTHGHAAGFLSRLAKRSDFELVGIAEPDAALCRRYGSQHHLDSSIFFPDLPTLIAKTKPEAVALFTSTFGHLAGVEACAKTKTPVMMEKPLAVSLEQAHAIQRLSQQAGIPVIVNYETTWYRSNRQAFDSREAIGGIRKVVIHDGHQGPKEIGVPPEFFSWLTDPAQNGAGALFDFGCYGADLMTGLMDGRRPLSVTAVTQQLKPEIYPKVDDEATVILTYPTAQAIIQASWNWPFDRKDMEVYGRTGYVLTVGHDQVKRRLKNSAEEVLDSPVIPSPDNDTFDYLKAVARRTTPPSGLSSLETNITAVEILDAARRSAKTGRTVHLASA